MSKKAKPKPPSGQYTVMGIRRSPLGWSVVRHTIKDGVITSTETTQPDLRDIALERLDIMSNEFWSPADE